MLRYALTPSNSSNADSNRIGTSQGRNHPPVPRVIALTDDARGADEYLAWRKRGFALRRIETQDGE